MWRDSLLFGAALLLALTAGRAFWVTLGESPFNMSAATYVEFFQQLDRRIAIPIAVTGVGGTLLAGQRGHTLDKPLCNQRVFVGNMVGLGASSVGTAGLLYAAYVSLP